MVILRKRAKRKKRLAERIDEMRFKETQPLPAVCMNCKEEDCYNCDNALDRWKLIREDKNKGTK